MKKLTRKQINDGLEAMPIETLLLGTSKQTTLTAKQKAFAEEVAKGNTKAGAYRKAYNSKAKPSSIAVNAHKLSQNTQVQLMIEAQKVALEAMKYQTPEHLRALTIHELTKHALNEAMPPAQRVKCLELLGKITEVALFTERREVVKVTDSAEAKAKLVQGIKLALGAKPVQDADYTDADSLMDELRSISPTAEDAGAISPTAEDSPAQHNDEASIFPTAEDRELDAMSSEASGYDYVAAHDNTGRTEEAHTREATPKANQPSADPRTPDPQIQARDPIELLHSNPHK